MRLFCFGESHVKYNYPTWADILLQEYEGFNCGEIGCSNQLITQRILETHLKYNFTSKDLIIINWANFFREDRYHYHSGWHCAGNVFHNLHNKSFVLNNYSYTSDQQWADIHYFLYRDFTSLKYANELLRGIGVNYIQTHTGKFFEDPEFLKIPDVRKLLDFYKSSIVYDLDSVSEFNYNTYNPDTRPKCTINGKDYFIEDHPLPNEHLKWLEELLLPKYGLSVSNKTKKWCNDWDDRISKTAYIKYPTDWSAKTPEWIID